METITILHWLYIDNHPDRRGFCGTNKEIVLWGVRMGLVTEAEAICLNKQET